MKVIRYNIPGKTGVYNPKTDAVEDVETICGVLVQWSESAEERAKREAYEGIYTIEDDGEPEPVEEPTDAERIAELEAALELLLSGAVE